jgi:hypothetical protein
MKELLIKEEIVSRLAAVSTLLHRFGVEGALAMVYGPKAGNRAEVHAWFSTDLLRCVDAASKAEHLARMAMDKTMLSPMPIVLPEDDD